MKRRSSIRRKMMSWFCFFAIFPILFLTVTAYGFSYATLRSREFDYAGKQLDMVLQSLNQQIRLSKNAMASVCLNGRLLNETNRRHGTWQEDIEAEQNAKDLLNAVSYSVTGVTITFINRENQVFTNGTPMNSAITMQEPFLQRMVERKTNWLIVRRSLYSKICVPAVTVGRSIYDKGEFVGVVFADILADQLDYIIGEEGFSPTNLYVFSEEELLYSFGWDGEPQSVTLQELLQAESRHGEYVQATCSGGGEGVDLAGLASIPKSEMYKGSFNLMLQGVGIILILLAESIVLSRLVGDSLSRDIVALNNAVKQFSIDGQPVSLSIRSSDELSGLAIGMEDMTRKISSLLEEIRQREREKYQLEAKTLMSQLSPHMIYNTLNTITFLAEAQGMRNIAEISDSFVQMLKLLADFSEDFLSVGQELDYMNRYVQIKKYNLLIPIRLEVEADEEALTVRIPKLLLQPFVENAIKHGFQHLLEEGVIRIRMEIRHDRLLCSVRDNGCGIPWEQQEGLFRHGESASGIGLANTWRRLQLYYGSDFSLCCESDGKSYTEFLLDLPAGGPAREHSALGGGSHDDRDGG